MSEQMGIRELRSDLSAAVRRAGSGERVVVTVDGSPVAELGPVDSGVEAVTLAGLVARGLVVPPRRSDRPPLPDPVPAWIGSRIDRLLREVRG
jgi:antitoxin (DNA-binding transcriptional repressor) of toxin-antitoxin stability system